MSKRMLGLPKNGKPRKTRVPMNGHCVTFCYRYNDVQGNEEEINKQLSEENLRLPTMAESVALLYSLQRSGTSYTLNMMLRAMENLPLLTSTRTNKEDNVRYFKDAPYQTKGNLYLGHCGVSVDASGCVRKLSSDISFGIYHNDEIMTAPLFRALLGREEHAKQLSKLTTTTLEQQVDYCGGDGLLTLGFIHSPNYLSIAPLEIFCEQRAFSVGVKNE